MKIETKFDIGQEVYYIVNYFDLGNISGEVKIGFIDNIVYQGNKIFYQVKNIYYAENYIFATREEAEKKLKEM